MSMTAFRLRVQQFLSTKEGQASYLSWMEHPCTQIFLGAAREAARPVVPASGPDAVSALYLLGLTVGGNAIIDLFEIPRSGTWSLEGVARMPKATYGAEGILNKETINATARSADAPQNPG